MIDVAGNENAQDNVLKNLPGCFHSIWWDQTMIELLVALYGILQVVAVAQANQNQRIAAMLPLFVAVPSYVYIFGPFNPDDSIFRGILFLGATNFFDHLVVCVCYYHAKAN